MLTSVRRPPDIIQKKLAVTQLIQKTSRQIILFNDPYRRTTDALECSPIHNRFSESFGN